MGKNPDVNFVFNVRLSRQFLRKTKLMMGFVFTYTIKMVLPLHYMWTVINSARPRDVLLTSHEKVIRGIRLG